MKISYLQKKQLPDAPGVYFFLGKNKEIFYIGKATSLKNRLKSYFAKDLLDTRGPLIVQMVAEAHALDVRVTDSVLEALILEADLIKKFQPRYNTKEKSDKSFNCVVVTKEEFPQILVVRKKDLESLPTQPFTVKNYFGPFPQGTSLKDALKIVRRIFPYRDNKCVPHQGKPCFNRQLGLCPGVCTDEISAEAYGHIVKNFERFFAGDKQGIVRDLTKQMRHLAQMQQFEQAQEIKKTLFALQHIQDISLLRTNNTDRGGQVKVDFRIEAYDIAHLSGTDVVGVMTVIENGFPQKSEYRKFKLRGDFGNNDTANLREIITRRLAHPEWSFPQLIVADGNDVQKKVIEDALVLAKQAIPVVAVTKDAHHRAHHVVGDEKLIRAHKQAILLANSEAHRFAITFHRDIRGKRMRG